MRGSCPCLPRPGRAGVGAGKRFALFCWCAVPRRRRRSAMGGISLSMWSCVVVFDVMENCPIPHSGMVAGAM